MRSIPALLVFSAGLLFAGRGAAGASATNLAPSSESPTKSYEAWKQSIYGDPATIVKYYTKTVSDDIARKLTVSAGGQALGDHMDLWKKHFAQAEAKEEIIDSAKRKLVIRSVLPPDTINPKEQVSMWEISFEFTDGRWMMTDYPQRQGGGGGKMVIIIIGLVVIGVIALIVMKSRGSSSGM